MWISLLVPLLVGAACVKPPPEPVWTPGTTLPTPRAASDRGLLDRRGLIHAHSVYSHDACDGRPLVDGAPDPACFEDFRRDLCAVQHDFVMLTDHRDSFTDTEFPETLLFRPERGDTLVERGGPVASWAACPDGRRSLILAGAESGTMPVGLEGHVAERATRGGIYGDATPEAIAQLKAKGAVVLVAHTEGWSADRLSTLPLDGFEMYNLHANTFLALGAVVTLLERLERGDLEGLPHPDLSFLSLFAEDPLYLDRWGTVLSRGHRRVTTLGTDCHRNSLRQLLQDGERIDSYRRMMLWFSNHLLVRPEADGSWDDRHLKDALRGGRLYGAFEVMGYPVGFDFHAEAGGRFHELGEEVPLASAPALKVSMPRVQHLDPARPPPALRTRLLLARDGGWDEVAAGDGALSFTPTVPGAYRAEVRMVPHHLRADLGADADVLLERDYVWIYANPIYVR